MAYSQALADRLRELLADRKDVTERRMFGGLCLMASGHMCVGVVGDELMVRVGPDAYEDALAQPHAREMDFTGEPMRGLVFVEADGLLERRALTGWVERALAFVATLPPK